MPYFAEFTDTFGGEPNYCWVRRATVEASDNRRAILKAARAALGLTGVKGDITADFGDEWHWRPRGTATVLMVRWSDAPEEIGEAKAED